MISIRVAKLEDQATIAGFVRDLYYKSFPRAERRAFADLQRLINHEDRFSLYLISSDENLCGFFSTWALAGVMYVEHFAIHSDYRGEGIGSVVLKWWQEQLSPIAFEVEPPEVSEQATKRIQFYERGGFHLLEVDYIQPPYRSGEPVLPMRLMCDASFGDFVDPIILSETIHRDVYGHNG